jgi:single-strand DNA-binding protein
MKGLNKVMLLGNVGVQPEVKVLPNEHKVARFSFATSEVFKTKDGLRTNETQWHNIIAWNSLANIIEKYVHKGDSLHIQGKLSYRQYQDADGDTHYITEIVADEIIMLGAKNEEVPS